MQPNFESIKPREWLENVSNYLKPQETETEQWTMLSQFIEFLADKNLLMSDNRHHSDNKNTAIYIPKQNKWICKLTFFRKDQEKANYMFTDQLEIVFAYTTGAGPLGPTEFNNVDFEKMFGQLSDRDIKVKKGLKTKKALYLDFNIGFQLLKKALDEYI
jgi:hypothetical protein